MTDTGKLDNALHEDLQQLLRQTPSIIVGSGHSSAYGLPSMQSIGDFLVQQLPADLPEDARKLWQRIANAVGENFEKGLDGLSASDKGVDSLLQTVRKLITQFFRRENAKAEKTLLQQGLLQDPHRVPFARFMKYLAGGSSPNAPHVNVVTTNYDTLIELFCDCAGLAIRTGFEGHRFRRFASGTLSQHVYSERFVAQKGKVRQHYTPMPHVRILKPHGSVDWVIQNGQAMEMLVYADSDEGALVVPGPFKYRDALVNTLFDDIRTEMNRVLKASSAVVALGFGFNDDHLLPVIKDRLGAGMPMLILTKDWTESIESLLEEHHQIVAFQEADTGAEVSWNGERFLDPRPLWELDVFLKAVTE